MSFCFQPCRQVVLDLIFRWRVTIYEASQAADSRWTESWFFRNFAKILAKIYFRLRENVIRSEMFCFLRKIDLYKLLRKMFDPNLLLCTCSTLSHSEQKEVPPPDKGTHIYSHTHTLIPLYPHTLIPSYPHTLTPLHTHTPTYSHTHILIPSHTHTPTYSHTHTLIPSHTYTPT